MATNYIQRGDHITIAAPATVTSGSPVFAGEIAGIALGNAASGQPVDLATAGVFDLPKVAAEAVDLGDAIFWDVADALATLDDDDTGAGNPKLGVAVAAAGTGTGIVRVRLSGF